VEAWLVPPISKQLGHEKNALRLMAGRLNSPIFRILLNFALAFVIRTAQTEDNQNSRT